MRRGILEQKRREQGGGKKPSKKQREAAHGTHTNKYAGQRTVGGGGQSGYAAKQKIPVNERLLAQGEREAKALGIPTRHIGAVLSLRLEKGISVKAAWERIQKKSGIFADLKRRAEQLSERGISKEDYSELVEIMLDKDCDVERGIAILEAERRRSYEEAERKRRAAEEARASSRRSYYY